MKLTYLNTADRKLFFFVYLFTNIIYEFEISFPGKESVVDYFDTDRKLCVCSVKMNNQASLLQVAAEHDTVGGRTDAQVDEIHVLRDNICRLLADNAELCDLCCFLDDDRQRHRREVAEWQKLHQQMATEIAQKVFQSFPPSCLYRV